MEALIVITLFIILLITNAMWFVVWYKSYSRYGMISFGNYLLSDERGKCASESCKKYVTHADMENWKDSQ